MPCGEQPVNGVESQPVSRVLSWTVIPLGRASPRASSDLPGSHAGRMSGPKPNAPLFGLAPDGVYPATSVASGAVRSYRTISPLPAPEGAWAVYFLWHFPSARAAQGLPGALPCGARTFLPPVLQPDSDCLAGSPPEL